MTMRHDPESEPKSEPCSSADSLERPPAFDCPILLTESLVLRPPHAEDIDAIAILADNPAIATMVSRIPHPYGRGDAETFVRASAKRGNGNCVYAITDAETGQLYGCCSLETGKDGRSLELGYWIGEPFWRRGIATQAVHALVDMAFRTREIEHIDARCRVINPASRRVLQKSGFQFQGSGMIDILSINASVAVEWFRLDRKTWISLIGWSNDTRARAS
ncbi:MAG: GNAT family N-acetyltransferase [Hoeflea sp.]|uniref:GNAT family N-acetyltransferase n=1 Tax=Hoeflea sp. TaxID=1940281 RepID=UPI001E002DD9|nr:GNAT family protein [Hoeflea sp.]MBU4529905.1 GNAT family N-acetyltransferase [Alphaproteobacteria bacterium]MBU4547074.1 GNAT family N-acetyltransferase [Alphaproteobacteria bacterium]MBU4548687.1 GNAT family N-acetyltransferase [Alphaproteobacteria bacterium]MBV1722398.1 GNAT family N-acetyltransferase [Hoeflea sp.]MBV1762446.1 GNAT family N-acetyltransferase [Hoeflea sp.]